MSSRTRLIILLLYVIGAALWITPTPEAISTQAWHCLHIFILTISGIIICPLPISLISLMGAMTAIVTKVLTFADVFSEFDSRIIWIIIFAFFIARAFLKTGLGHRLAYLFISKLGHKIIGLSYGLLFTECILAPLIPSVAARSGGIIYPITQSIITAYTEGESANAENLRKTGAYLVNICNHGGIICSAMFLTSMAGNPLAAELASRMGVQITWTTWALGAIVPGLICLLLLPWTLCILSPSGIKQSDKAPMLAKNELNKMGPMQTKEISMLIIFFMLISGWIFEQYIGIDPTSITILGVLTLILIGVLTWEDITKEKGAWDTMIWFAILLAFSSQLSRLGIMNWIASVIIASMSALQSPLLIGVLLCAIYFYLHYFFASLTAHITVFYSLFLQLMIHASLPPLGSALILGYLSNLYGGLTHYGSGASPIFFGSGYQNIQQWWYVALIVCTLNLCIWLSISLLWLPAIGLI